MRQTLKNTYKINVISALEYALMALVILECRSVYNYTVTVDYHIPELTILVLLILTLIKFCMHGLDQRLFLRLFVISLGLWIFMIAYMLVNVPENSMFGFLCKFIIGIPMATLLYCIYIKEGDEYCLLNKFYRLMVIEATVSLVFWLLGSQLHIIRPTSYVRANWGFEYNYPSYYGLYFERQKQTFFGFSGLRNLGIFNEAPMHSLCLIFALAVSLFLDEDGRNKKTGNIILVIAVITTITTTGYIVLLIICFLAFLSKRPNRRVYYLKIFVGFLIGVAVMSLAVVLFMYKESSRSWAERRLSYELSFRAWLSSPIFGNGYASKEVMERLNHTSTASAIANSIATILMQGGLVLFSVYIIPIIGFIKTIIQCRRWKLVAFIIVFLLEFVFTSFSYTFLMLLYIGMFAGIWLGDTLKTSTADLKGMNVKKENQVC